MALLAVGTGRCMSITTERAEELLKLPKKLIVGGKVLDTYSILQSVPFNEHYELISADSDEISFLFAISQGPKNYLRISLHVQEDDSKIGLLRVDFNSPHTNPVVASKQVPKKFRVYAGKRFLSAEHHIHYHVEGYKTLAWAVPLSDDEFAVKTIDSNNTSQSLINAIFQFAKVVNIKTILSIMPTIL